MNPRGAAARFPLPHFFIFSCKGATGLQSTDGGAARNIKLGMVLLRGKQGGEGKMSCSLRQLFFMFFLCSFLYRQIVVSYPE